MPKLLLPLIFLVSFLAWLFWDGDDGLATKGNVQAPAAEQVPARGLTAPSSATHRPLFGMAASPLGQLDCSHGVQTTACNPDDIKEDAEQPLPVEAMIQMQSSYVMRGQYQRMPELTSSLLECTALSEASKQMGDSKSLVAGADSTQLATCDTGNALSIKHDVRTALLAATRAGNVAAKTAYAEFLKLELLEAIAALYRAREGGRDAMALKQKVLSGKEELRAYLHTGALDADPDKPMFVSLQDLEAEPAVD